MRLWIFCGAKDHFATSHKNTGIFCGLKIRGGAAFGFAAGDEIGQFFADGDVHWWGFEFVQDGFVQHMRPFRRPDAARRFPGLIVFQSDRAGCQKAMV